MSAGHDVSDWAYADTVKVDHALRSPSVESHLRKFKREDDSWDLPYLAGYSIDGTTIFFDRHLPEELTAEMPDGGKLAFNPRRFIRTHEEVEKALIDALGWDYLRAHQIANGAERREVLAAGIPWKAYEDAIEPYIKADEHEKIKQVPADLDLTPYKAPPVNKKLLKHMQKAMGEQKIEKTEADYSDDRGYPKRHCGPTSDWPEYYCKYYGDYDCEKVLGYIQPKGGCDLYEKVEE